MLESGDFEVTTTTSYTPPSNRLVELTHGVILSLARAAIEQAKMPMSFREYAVQHVATCGNVVPHSETKKVPYDTVFGTSSLELKHIKPFGCRMLYHQVMAKLLTFSTKLREGICLGHD